MKLQHAALFLVAMWLGPNDAFAAEGASAGPPVPKSVSTDAKAANAAATDAAYDPTRQSNTPPKPLDAKSPEAKPADARVPDAKARESQATEPAIQIPAASAKRIGPAPVPSLTKSFIWKVTSPTNTIHLFGTIHVGKRAFYPLPEQVETAFDQSARLAVEADVSDQAGTGDVAELVSYSPPDTLDKHIPMPLFERLKTQLARLRIPVSAVQPMKPFVAGGFLSVVEYSRLGYDMMLGVDSYLISRARQAGKPVEELETARAQLELLANMPAELQEAFLDNAISMLETERAADQVTGMVNAWQTGDVPLMTDVTLEVNKGMRLGSRLDEVLLYSRHDAMVKKIEGYLAGKVPYFVAVGSLHLVGPRGLVQALKAKGYEVTQK